MKFKIDNELNFVNYGRATWERFPAPNEAFKIIADNCEYITSKRKLVSRCTSFGKIFDRNNAKITHRAFCDKHRLRRGQLFEVMEIAPFMIYRIET